MAERKVAWKPRNENTLIGKRIPRTDGIEKASGSAKYAADINTPGTLFARALVCTKPHAKIVTLDVTPAEAIEGVRGVQILRDVDAVCQWDGTIVAVVAADRPEIADDGVRAIEVTYKDLPFFVDEDNIEAATEIDKKNVNAEGDLTDEAAAQGQPIRTKDFGLQEKGDVAAALKNAAVVHKGYYGIATISHMCMEPHGSHCEFTPDGKLTVHLSTQNVSGTAGGFAEGLGIEISKVSVICNYVGGGFGSKFAPGEWGLACAELARKTGKPVRFMLDRATELKTAGIRPSGFANVTIAADAEGKIVAWDSHHWGSDGVGAGIVSIGQYPYVFEFENRNRKGTGIAINGGPVQAWRAPPHPQLCALTHTAIDDLAAKLDMSSYDVFLKNLDKTERPQVYAEEMKIAAKLIDWNAKWHPRGKGGGNGPVKQGVGMALHKWGGAPHAAACLLKIHPDGSVESIAGSQDIGTG
ncbi:MAG: xanthine dehydrogenase family protein, partial [Planctomycetaceae bacterium]